MKLIPKYKGGNKTYQFRRYGDVDLPVNIKILDERGLEISPDENTKILTDSDGNPVNRSWLVANGYHYSPSPETVYANNQSQLASGISQADGQPNLGNHSCA